MWTPKRIVLLALGFFAFLSSYMLYATALGGIDGLPPLPAADLPPDHPGMVGPLPSHGLKLEDKLRQAFGQDCPELKYTLKLELNSKNMVVAARDFTIQDDGRLELEKISVALFKDDRDGRGVEINTIRANKAFLTFDKKLGQNDKDFGGRHIIAAELIGDSNVPADDIEIVNNHRTPQRDDDLHLNIRKGPLYYDESKSLIWTDDDVRLEDDQNQPPTVVCGRGMEVHLAAPENRPEAKPAARAKPRSGGFSGVERIVVKSFVDMNLYVAGGFLSNPPGGTNAKPAAPAAPPEKAHININTPGRFEYEFRKDGDVARFERARGRPRPPSPGQRLRQRDPLQLRCSRNQNGSSGFGCEHGGFPGFASGTRVSSGGFRTYPRKNRQDAPGPAVLPASGAAAVAQGRRTWRPQRRGRPRSDHRQRPRGRPGRRRRHSDLRPTATRGRML